MLKKTGLLLIATCVCMVAAAQQQISGRIVDDRNDPIDGASVMVDGTKNGTITDVDGRFTLAAPADGTLTVSHTDYVPQKIAVGGRTFVQIALAGMTAEMDEVVVIGYGSAQKVGNIVGSVQTITAAEIELRPNANVADAMQGKIPGLQIFSESGEPMSVVHMKLRGNSSLSLSTSPLYILDGIPVTGQIFTQLNPQDIENISVLKDASSTAIYGSRAANGVIFITTKKGKKGDKPVISFRAQYGISMLTNYNMDMMNSEELIRFEEICRPELKIDPAYQAKKAFILGNGINFNWTDYLFDNAAPLKQADISVRGATENTNYFTSLGYYSEQGTAKANSGVDRFTFRTNVDTKITDWLRFGSSIALTYSKYSTVITGWYANSPIMQAITGLPYFTPYEMIYNEDGTVSYGDVQWVYPWASNLQIDLNEFYKYNTNDQAQANLMGQTFLQITPIAGLTIRAIQAIDAFDFTNTAIALPSYGFATGITPMRQESFQRYYQLSSTNTVEYKFHIGRRHSFIALAGHESIVKKNKSFNAKGEGYNDDRLMTFGDAVNIVDWAGNEMDSSSNSFFANVNYNLDRQYFIDASVRTDGSSLFGYNHRYATFFSVGGMWKIKEEPFLKTVNWIDDLNLNVSYGTTGNSGMGTWYASLGLIGSGPSYNGKPGWGISQFANDDLTWETVASFNSSVSGRLANRVNFKFEFYNRNSRDLIMTMPFSSTTGHSGGTGNIASLRNRGIDIELSVDLIHRKNIYWLIRGNVNYNSNKITKLYQNLDELKFPNSGQIYKVGESSTVIWLQKFAGVDPHDGEPMWYDLNGNLTKTFTDDIRQVCDMDTSASWSGGFSTNFSWKDLSLGVDFSWIGERWIFIDERHYTANPNERLQNSNFERRMLDIWTTPGQKTNIPKFGTIMRSDTSIYSNASFLRLKNLSLSYAIPDTVIKKSGFISGMKVYFTARNLWTVTGFEGYDPEVGYSNATQGMYPNSRQFVCGLELTF